MKNKHIIVPTLAVTMLASTYHTVDANELTSTEQATTEVPSSEQATTEAPSTEQATTEVPSTEQATTEVPSTEQATTEAPSTEQATTEVPSSEQATTEAPSSEQATTEAPSSEQATTEAPSSEQATTEAPSYRMASITANKVQTVDQNSPVTNDEIERANEVPLVEYSYIDGTYKAHYRNGYARPEGIVAHETANQNSTIHGEIGYMTRNKDNAFVHAFVDADHIIEVAPTEYLAWGAGPVANERFMHVELVEHNNREQFVKSINNYAAYLANMLYRYKLGVDQVEYDQVGTLWSHRAVSQFLGGTNHVDPHGYLERNNYNFQDLVKLVTKKYDALVSKQAKPIVNLPYTESQTNQMARMNTDQDVVYNSVTDVTRHSSKDMQDKAYFVKRQVKYNADTYMLLQNSESGQYLGWVKSQNLEHYNIVEETPFAKKANVNGTTPGLLNRPFGTDRQMSLIFDKAPTSEFNIEKQVRVGPHTYLYGLLDNTYGWLNLKQLISDQIVSEPRPEPVPEPTPAEPKQPEPTEPIQTKPSVVTIAKQVINGEWGVGSTRRTKLTEAGYNYREVQSVVNRILAGETVVETTPTTPTPKPKQPTQTPSQPKNTKSTQTSLVTIAKQVINGEWGIGSTRRAKLNEAGYNYREVQSIVNRILAGETVVEPSPTTPTPKPTKPKQPTQTPSQPKDTTSTQTSLVTIAKQVINGEWGVGSTRRAKLNEAGYNYREVQSVVNRILAGETVVETTPTNPAPKPTKPKQPTQTPSQPKDTTSTQTSLVTIAKQVINGEWGIGSTRRAKLNEAGYNYREVQSVVNKILTGKPITTKVEPVNSTVNSPDLTQIARDVISGKYGVGSERRYLLEKAGYSYTEVQALVNRML